MAPILYNKRAQWCLGLVTWVFCASPLPVLVAPGEVLFIPCGWPLIALCGVFLFLVVWIACNDFNRFHGLLLACWVERSKGGNKFDFHIRTGISVLVSRVHLLRGFAILPFWNHRQTPHRTPKQHLCRALSKKHLEKPANKRQFSSGLQVSSRFFATSLIEKLKAASL